MCATPVSPTPLPASVPLTLRWRGSEPYQTSFDAMRAFTDERTADTPDEIWLVEHPPVFTLGQAGDPAHLLAADSGIPLVKVDRGGQITYHGPGQVVAYLLLDLRRRKLMVRELVTRIEQAVIDTLAAYNLAGERKAGAPGIYVAPGPNAGLHAGAKIAALGLKIRNGCSYHGVSLNVSMDLRPFLAINPCGYAGLETVDMATLGVTAGWDDVAHTFAARLTATLDGNSAAVAQPQAGALTA
jgi:lipoyl(octanoyl) transferase